MSLEGTCLVKNFEAATVTAGEITEVIDFTTRNWLLD